MTVPNGEERQREQMTEHFGVQKFQSLVDVLGRPVVRLDVERFDESVKLAGGLVESDVDVVHVVRSFVLLIVGQTGQDHAALLEFKRIQRQSISERCVWQSAKTAPSPCQTPNDNGGKKRITANSQTKMYFIRCIFEMMPITFILKKKLEL